MGAGRDGRSGVRRCRADRASRSATRRSSTWREFSLNGPGMKAVRQSVSRAATPRLHHPRDPARDARPTPTSPTLSGRRRPVARRRRRRARLLDGARPARGPPRRRSACWSQPATPTAQLRGFLSFVPWGRNGLSLDLMRRDPTADNGLVELMVACAGRAARDVRRRPGLAQLRDVPRGVRARRRDRRRPGRPAVAAGPPAGQPQLAARVPLPLQREVPPEWQPRYMCFEYASDLPRVGTAAGSAEGFLTAPVDLDAAPHRARATTTLDTGGRGVRGRGRSP